MRKYELTKETKVTECGKTLHRIRRLSDGVLGGWIESEANLSHAGSCWIADEAQVYKDAWVSGSAQVDGDAWVGGEALVYGDARVGGSAQVGENARVDENAQVYGRAQVGGNARVGGRAQVGGNAQVGGDARVFGSQQVTKCLYIQQFRYNITATNTHVAIGCELHTWAQWMRNITAIGKAYDYTKAEIAEIKQLLQILRKQIKRAGKK